MGLPIQPRFEKTVHQMEHADSPVKKKFRALQSVKKGAIDSLLGHERSQSLLLSLKKKQQSAMIFISNSQDKSHLIH